jgi:DNA-binding SARP family transcriptional activator
MLDFRILGPLEVLDEEQGPLPLGPPAQRALLALLALHHPEMMTSDRLVDALWGERPPATATKTIQVYVSRLRKVLGDTTLVTRGKGYGLGVESSQIDARRFEQQFEEGRALLGAGATRRGAEKLREALSLWRGAALADLADQSSIQEEVAPLEELRLSAIEERIDAQLAAGTHGELVAELQRLVREHPLRERLRGQLMLALYRAGRQAEALGAFQDARRTLVDGLGLEPGPALRRLERAILHQDPALESATTDGRHPLQDRGAVFVGREHELEELSAGLEASLAGHGRLFLLTGDPGIGKSRLAGELASKAARREAEVLVGRCWEAGGAPAFWPWVQALRACIQGREIQTLRSLLGAGAPEVAAIVPDLRELFPDLEQPFSLQSEGARFRLFDGVSTFLRRAAQVKPIVLILDDVHAADAPSLLLLEFFAREIELARVFVLASYRDVAPTVDEPLASSLAGLARQGATSLRLTGLSHTEVGSFVELTTQRNAADSLITAIHEQTEGNPLFVGELVQLLEADGRLEDLEHEDMRPFIPRAVQTVIDRRLDRLPDECREILSLASVFGRVFRLDALEQLSERSRDVVLRSLDQAIADRLISERPGLPVQFRFSHALIRDVLYDEYSLGRRLELHGRAGEALEQIYQSDPEPHWAEIAHHFVSAAQGDYDPGKAIKFTRLAAERAARLLAFEEAMRLFGSALQLAESTRGMDDETLCELLLSLGDAQARAGEGELGRATFLRAADVARRLGSATRLARAALGYGGRLIWSRAYDDEHIVPLLEEALGALGEEEGELRAKVMSRLAGALRDESDPEPRHRLSHDAVQLARRLGDPETLAYALDARWFAVYSPEYADERLAIAEELLELAERSGEPERIAAASFGWLHCQFERGDLGLVHSGLDSLATLTGALRQPAQLWLAAACRATLALFEGRFDEAQERIEQAVELGLRAQHRDAVLSHRVQLFTLRWQLGGLADIEGLLLAAARDYPARPMFRCMLAILYSDSGREANARRLLEDLTAGDFAALPVSNDWLFSMGFLAEVATDMADLARASAIYERLLPYAAHHANTTDYISTGSVARPLGTLAGTLGLHDEAERHFERALEHNRRMGARPWVAHTEREYARALRSRGQPGDDELAEYHSAQALAAFRELGLLRWEQKVREEIKTPPFRVS